MKKGERDFKRWEGLVGRWERCSKVPKDMGKNGIKTRGWKDHIIIWDRNRDLKMGDMETTLASVYSLNYKDVMLRGAIEIQELERMVNVCNHWNGKRENGKWPKQEYKFDWGKTHPNVHSHWVSKQFTRQIWELNGSRIMTSAVKSL